MLLICLQMQFATNLIARYVSFCVLMLFFVGFVNIRNQKYINSPVRTNVVNTIKDKENKNKTKQKTCIYRNPNMLHEIFRHSLCSDIVNCDA